MSNFLSNLARRGAGLAPGIAPRLPAFSPPASLSTAATSPMSAADAGLEADVPAPHVTPNRLPLRRSEPNLELGEASIANRRAPAPAASASFSPSRRPHEALPVIQKPVPPARASSVPEPRVASGLPAPSTPRRSDPSPDAEPVAAAPEPRAPVAPRRDPGPEPARAVAPRRDAGPEPLRPLSTAAVVVAPAVVRHAPPPQPAMPVVALPQARPQRRSAPSSAAPPSSTPAAAPAGAPHVQVRIGKVEIRASQPAAPAARASRPKGSGGFDELALARAHLNRNYR